MTTPDTTQETRIGRDWPRSVGMPLAAAFVVACSAYGVQIEDPSGYYETRFHSASFWMLPVFSVLVLVALKMLLVPFGAPVRLSPDGFADLRAAPVTVPWSEITNAVRRGQYVVLTLSRRIAKDFPFTLTQRALKAMRKSAGPSHLLVADWCLAITPTDLADLVAAYRQAHAEGPAHA